MRAALRSIAFVVCGAIASATAQAQSEDLADDEREAARALAEQPDHDPEWYLPAATPGAELPIARDTDEEPVDAEVIRGNKATATTLAGPAITSPAVPVRGEGSRRYWDPQWRRFGPPNYVLAIASWTISGASFLIPPQARPWRSTSEIDEWGRRNLRLFEDQNRSRRARDASDVLLSVMIAYPFLIDSLVVTYWYRQSHDVAGQMAMITAETLGVASAVQGLTAGLASRERPYGRDCGTRLDSRLDECVERNRFRSFFSGHTAVSFASAGVSCSHHFRHRVFGRASADAIACGSAFVTAGAVGMLRIVADQHYVTDVAAGAVAGTAIGMGVPWLLHYGPLARVQPATGPAGTTVSIVPYGTGLGIGGTF